MPEANRDYVGLYGNVRIPKAYCKTCGRYAFVIGGKMACCDADHRPEPVCWKRESSPPYERKLPSVAERKAKLEEQDYACFWCFRRFGLAVWLGRRSRVLKLNWDHMVPWAYDQNNSPQNFVASCNVCNNWKSSLIFQTIEQCRVYLKGKWDEKQSQTEEDASSDEVPELSGRIHSEEEMGKILLDEVPMEGVERPTPARKPFPLLACSVCGRVSRVRNSNRLYCSSECRRKDRKRESE